MKLGAVVGDLFAAFLDAVKEGRLFGVQAADLFDQRGFEAAGLGLGCSLPRRFWSDPALR